MVLSVDSKTVSACHGRGSLLVVSMTTGFKEVGGLVKSVMAFL